MRFVLDSGRVGGKRLVSEAVYREIFTPQVIAPPEMRGRATGVLSLFIGSAMFGHYHTGWLFERLGSAAAMQVMVVEGMISMLGLGILWWRIPGKPA